MAVLVADNANTAYDGKLSTANGFYTSYAYNVGSFRSNASATPISLATPHTINVTFASNSNILGVILFPTKANGFNEGTADDDRTITVSFKESGVEKRSVTKTRADIMRTATRSAGTWGTPFVFSSAYAVDTTASKYTIVVTMGGTKGSTYCINCSDAVTTATFVTWSDTQATFSSGSDMIVAKNKIIIDMTASFKEYTGTGYASLATCFLGCTPDTLNDNIIEWNNPAAAYTLTINGWLQLSTGGVFQIISPDTTKQAKIVCTSTITGGSGITHVGNLYHTYYQGLGIDWQGATPTNIITTLTADWTAGDTITVADSTGFLAGDIVQVAKENYYGFVSNTCFTVASIPSATSIKFTGSVSGLSRLSGGIVMRKGQDEYGIWCTSSTTASLMRIYNPWIFTLKGIYFDTLFYFQLNYGATYLNTVNEDSALYEEWLVEDCQSWGQSGGDVYLVAYANPNLKGMRFNRCYTFYTGLSLYNLGAPYISSTLKYNYGTFTMTNCVGVRLRTGGLFSVVAGQYSKATITDNIVQNCQWLGMDLSCLDLTFTGNEFWGGGPYTQEYPILRITSLLGTTTWDETNTINKCYYGMSLRNSYVTDTYIEGITFGDETANLTADISLTAETYSKLVIGTTYNATTVDTVTQAFQLNGSYLRIEKYNNTAGDSRGYYKQGFIVATGDGLTDTTVHTSGTGKYALRYEFTTSGESLELESKIPTGNIQNLDAAVGVWVKISSANFYSGTYRLPRLTINYDNGTTAYAQAAAVTDWQYIFVPFTPATTYGEIEVTLDAQTDQTTTNSYVYWDDFSMFFPAGTTLNLGGFDLWSRGVPISPYISTTISALDVWNADPSLFGAGTIGQFIYKKVLTVAKFLGLK